MRDIRFRAWDKNRKKMASVEGLYNPFSEEDSRTRIILKFDDYIQEKIFLQSRIALMQYTGLKDSNGVEIYEGDILSTDLDRPYLIVEFRNGAFMFQCHDNGKDYYDFMTSVDENSNFTKYHKVIGNIYEHPHLCSGD